MRSAGVYLLESCVCGLGFVFKTRSHVAQAGPRLTREAMMTLNLFCHLVPSTAVIGVSHHTIGRISGDSVFHCCWGFLFVCIFLLFFIFIFIYLFIYFACGIVPSPS